MAPSADKACDALVARDEYDALVAIFEYEALVEFDE